MAKVEISLPEFISHLCSVNGYRVGKYGSFVYRSLGRFVALCGPRYSDIQLQWTIIRYLLPMSICCSNLIYIASENSPTTNHFTFLPPTTDTIEKLARTSGSSLGQGQSLTCVLLHYVIISLCNEPLFRWLPVHECELFTKQFSAFSPFFRACSSCVFLLIASLLAITKSTRHLAIVCPCVCVCV